MAQANGLGLNLLTHSRIGDFKKCRRKEYFRYKLGVRKQKSEALRIGGAIHDAQDIIHQGGTIEDARFALRANYAKLMVEARSVEAEEALRLEETKCLCLTTGWVWRWQNDPYEVIASELAFELPIINPETNHPTPNYRLAGKLDTIVHLPSGVLAIREAKIMGDSLSLDSRLWQQFQVSTQDIIYLLAARDLGYDVSTVFYDVIHKPDIAPKMVTDHDADGRKIVCDATGERVYKKNGEPRESGDTAKGYVLQQHRETNEEYSGRLMQDIYKRPDFYYARREMPRFDSDIQDMRHELWQLQRDMAETVLRKRYYKNEFSCVAPWTCDYLNVCAARTDLEHEIPDGFEQIGYRHPELEKLNDDESTTSPAAEDGWEAACAAG
jgi:hypothetical protein